MRICSCRSRLNQWEGIWRTHSNRIRLAFRIRLSGGTHLNVSPGHGEQVVGLRHGAELSRAPGAPQQKQRMLLSEWTTKAELSPASLVLQKPPKPQGERKKTLTKKNNNTPSPEEGCCGSRASTSQPSGCASSQTHPLSSRETVTESPRRPDRCSYSRRLLSVIQ